MRLKSKSTVKTVSLDRFVRDNALGSIDFLKMDLQGAELDILRGATRTLSSIVVVHTEVNFVQMYRDQPLFACFEAVMRGAPGSVMSSA